MTSSSSPQLGRGLDTMLLVYSFLNGHPAAIPCTQFFKTHSGWFTSPLVLFEAKNILTKVYSIDPADATIKLAQFAAGPIVLLNLDPSAVVSVLQMADKHGLDLTDAVLLHLTQQHAASRLATDDHRLAQACSQLGVTPESPVDPALRQQITTWESANLAPKGLARILHRVHLWLKHAHPQAGQDFWVQTKNGSHLP